MPQISPRRPVAVQKHAEPLTARDGAVWANLEGVGHG
jgi:hypothetical protein